MFQDLDEDSPLLSPLGYILFWTQFGLGLGLFLCLVIAIGLLVWCKTAHRPPRAADSEQPEINPEQPEANSTANTSQDRSAANPCSERPTISGPISNLNSALDETHSDSEEESIYNEPMDDTDQHYQNNPFNGWTVSSSFRPVGPPPPPPETIPMVVRPVAKKDKSTMTDCPRPKKAMPNGTAKSRSDIKSGYMASPETSLDRPAGARPKQQQCNSLKGSSRTHDDGPTQDLPPLPARSSSLRHKKRGGGKRKNAASTAATMSY